MCNIYIPGFKGNFNKNKEKEIYCLSVTDYCSVFRTSKKIKGFCKLFCVACLSFWFPYIAAKSEYNNILQDMVPCIMACTSIKTDAFNFFGLHQQSMMMMMQINGPLEWENVKMKWKIMTAPTLLPCGSNRLVVSSYISLFPNLFNSDGDTIQTPHPFKLVYKIIFFLSSRTGILGSGRPGLLHACPAHKIWVLSVRSWPLPNKKLI